MELTNNRTLMKQANFRKLLCSQTFNSLAEILLQVTVMVAVYDKTNSVFGAASVAGVMALSSFVSGMAASYFIHRFKLKQIIHMSGWLSAIFAIVIGMLLYSTNVVHFPMLYGALVFYSFIATWYQPARFALLPLTVGKEHYVKANGFLVMVDQTLMTAGWAIGGLLTVYVKPVFLIAGIACAFILSGIAAARLNIQEKKPETGARSGHAWKKVWSIPLVRDITVMDIIEGGANAIWASALLLSFTYAVLKEGPDVWGFINAAYFIGAVIGSIVVTWKSGMFERRIGIMIGLSGLSMGTLTLLFSFNTNMIVALLLCILMGPMYQARDVCQTAVLQNAIPAKDRANVMAARTAFLTPWNGIMVMAVGWLADFAGIQAVYVWAGIAYLAASLIAFQRKSLRNYSSDSDSENA